MKIFFDMDGVLSDFDGGIRNLCGLDPEPQGKSTLAAMDRMFEGMRQVPHFYGRLEPLPGAVELFTEIWTQFGNNCQILTGIPKPSRGIVGAEEDKREWVSRFISPDVVVNVVLRKEKPQFCTGPDCILIDDFVAYIREWEKTGGSGILHRSVDETRKQLYKFLENRN